MNEPNGCQTGRVYDHHRNRKRGVGLDELAGQGASSRAVKQRGLSKQAQVEHFAVHVQAGVGELGGKLDSLGHEHL